MNTTNDAARALIKNAEQLKLDAYICPAGKPTIGWGHTGDVKMGQSITEHQADVLFEFDLHMVEEQVSKAVEVELNQNQFSALVSFVFNVGERNFKASRLLKLLNRGLFQAAAEQLPLWCHARDPKTQQMVKLPGLVKRRAAERALFLTSVS